MIIELPKRVGGTDVEYLQQQINAMKNQLENAYGGAGSGVTIEEIKAMRLEVGKEIKMGPNAVISWLQVTDNEDVASVEATNKAIEEMEKKINTNVSENYVPYTTDISGNHVISETFIANNLQIVGGLIDINTSTGSEDRIKLNYSEYIGSNLYKYVSYLSTEKLTLAVYKNGSLYSGSYVDREGVIALHDYLNKITTLIEPGGISIVNGLLGETNYVVTDDMLESYAKKSDIPTNVVYRSNNNFPSSSNDFYMLGTDQNANGKICWLSKSQIKSYLGIS